MTINRYYFYYYKYILHTTQKINKYVFIKDLDFIELIKSFLNTV